MEGAQLCTWKIPSAKNELWGHILKWHFQLHHPAAVPVCGTELAKESKLGESAP